MNDINQAEGAEAWRECRRRADPAAALAAAEAKADRKLEQLPAGRRGVGELSQAHRARDRQRAQVRHRALRAGTGDRRGFARGGHRCRAPRNPGPALLEGAEATLKQLHRAFDKAGIKIIDPAGPALRPEWHEAMVAQESADQPANTVLSVIQKGYSLNGRLLRPARVIVSKAPGGDGN